MTHRIVRIICDHDLTEDIIAAGANVEAEFSRPQPFESHVESLNAPIGPSELIAGAEVVTAIFTASTAFIVFIEKVKSVVDKESKCVILKDKTGDLEIKIDKNTDVSDVKKFFEKNV